MNYLVNTIQKFAINSTVKKILTEILLYLTQMNELKMIRNTIMRNLYKKTYLKKISNCFM